MFNFWQSITSTTTPTPTEINEPAKESETPAPPTLSVLSSWLSNVAEQVTFTIQQVNNNTNKVELVEQQNDTITTTTPAIKQKLPWEAEEVPAHWKGHEQELKTRILYISSKPEYFVRSKSSAHHFDYDSNLAVSMLEQDKRLAKLRFELVPLRYVKSTTFLHYSSLAEDAFWQRYFLLVDNLIHKQYPAQHYVEQLQRAVQSGTNLEQAIKNAQMLKLQISEYASEDDSFLALNTALYQLLHKAVDLHRPIKAMNAVQDLKPSSSSPTQQQQQQSVPAISAAPAAQQQQVHQHEETMLLDAEEEDLNKMPWDE